jgi:hypothetical protein
MHGDQYSLALLAGTEDAVRMNAAQLAMLVKLARPRTWFFAEARS